jgi:hypothetical protein
VLWSAFMVVNVGWPRAATYGSLWQHRYAPLLLTAGLLALSAAAARAARFREVRAANV